MRRPSGVQEGYAARFERKKELEVSSSRTPSQPASVRSEGPPNQDPGTSQMKFQAARSEPVQHTDHSGARHRSPMQHSATTGSFAADASEHRNVQHKGHHGGAIQHAVSVNMDSSTGQGHVKGGSVETSFGYPGLGSTPPPPVPPPALDIELAPAGSSGLIDIAPPSLPVTDGAGVLLEAPAPPVPPPSVLSEHEKVTVEPAINEASRAKMTGKSSGYKDFPDHHQQRQPPQQRQQQHHHQHYNHQLNHQHNAQQQHIQEIPTAPAPDNLNADGEVVALIDGLLAGLRSAVQNPQRYEGMQQSAHRTSPSGGPQHDARGGGISNLGRALARQAASQTGRPPRIATASTPSSVLTPPKPPRTAPVAKPTVSSRYINPSDPNAHQPALRTKKQRRDLRNFLEENFGSVARGFDALVRTVNPGEQDQNERMTYKLSPEEFNDALRRVGYEQLRRTKKDNGWWDGLVEAIDMDGDELISLQDAIDSLLIAAADFTD